MRASRWLPFLSIAILSSVSFPALAEEVSSKARLGADATVLVPVGDLSKVTGLMLGPLVHFEYSITPSVWITGRTGYLYGLRKELSTGVGSTKFGLSAIPIWGGVKYYFAEGQGPYVGGELGLNILMASTESSDSSLGGAGSGSSSETKVRLNAGAGYRAGKLDLRAGIAFLDLGHAGDSMAILGSVGYSFAAF